MSQREQYKVSQFHSNCLFIKKSPHMERHRQRVICSEYSKDLAKGSPVVHRQTQHSVEKGGWGRCARKKVGETSPGLTGWRLPQNQDQWPAQSKGVVTRRRRIQRCSCTSGTGTSRIPWWYLRRENPLTYDVLCATCWCHGCHWTGCTGA